MPHIVKLKYYLQTTLIIWLESSSGSEVKHYCMASEASTELNVCTGGAGYCDATWKSYPNINSALLGIDLPSLNPVPNDFISEPGVRNQIFQATYREEFGNIAQYDFVQPIDDLRCSMKFDESVYNTFEELIAGWSSMETTGR